MTNLSDAHKRANKKWNTKNRERMKYLRYRSGAKNFILKKATVEDLQFLQDLINERLTQ